MEIKNHRLVGDKVKYEATSKTSGKFAAGQPDTIIIHYTAGPKYSSAYVTLMNPNVKSSAHLLVDLDGATLQMIDFNVKGWHAGVSEYGGRQGFNSFSIGIEIVNAGFLVKKDSGFSDLFGTKIPEDQVVEGTHRNSPQVGKYWMKYPDAQIAAVKEICRQICANYPIKFILGHEEIAPGRKFDPGPAFPLDAFREELLNGKKEETANTTDGTTPSGELTFKKGDAAFVTVNDLNIRAGAGPNFETVSNPLSNGTIVEVVEDAGKWVKVHVPIVGWARRGSLEFDNTDGYPDGIVSLDNTELKSGADDSFAALTKPLKKGTEFIVVGAIGDWRNIVVNAEGYVFKKFLSKKESDVKA